MMNGHHVAGSAFPYACLHPSYTTRQACQDLDTGIRMPNGITSNFKEEIFVSLYESSTNIIKFKADGKRVDMVKKHWFSPSMLHSM